MMMLGVIALKMNGKRQIHISIETVIAVHEVVYNRLALYTETALILCTSLNTGTRLFYSMLTIVMQENYWTNWYFLPA